MEPTVTCSACGQDDLPGEGYGDQFLCTPCGRTAMALSGVVNEYLMSPTQRLLPPGEYFAKMRRFDEWRKRERT